jgi:hypothetical protein
MGSRPVAGRPRFFFGLAFIDIHGYWFSLKASRGEAMNFRPGSNPNQRYSPWLKLSERIPQNPLALLHRAPPHRFTSRRSRGWNMSLTRWQPMSSPMAGMKAGRAGQCQNGRPMSWRICVRGGRENTAKEVKANAFISDCGQSIDWIFSGDVRGMIC